MKLLFKQRMFSWFDSYDIYDENENTVYVVKGQLSWGHCLKIFDTEENELGTVKQEVLTWLPKFELYEGENYIGCLEKELGWFKPKYNIDFNGWHVEGDFPGWAMPNAKPLFMPKMAEAPRVTPIKTAINRTATKKSFRMRNCGRKNFFSCCSGCFCFVF